MRSLVAATIFALASGAGRASVAIVRLSGPQAGAALQRLTDGALPPPRQAQLAAIKSADRKYVLDRGLVLWFPGPNSFTGEDVVEFQLHGGRAVLAGLFEALATIEGLRPAEPGEFSRRAFENGKLDLTEAEAIADLIAADTEAQRRQALRQLDGALGRLYEDWRQRLLSALAHWEAAIDFPDEDLPEGIIAAERQAVAALGAEITAHLADSGRGEKLREGLTAAILGPPNSGKSSLINYLARRDVAIVSAQAGTTRDVIEVAADLGGYPVTFVDTAGLRETGDEIEREGVRRAKAEARRADIKLLLLEQDGWRRIPADIATLIDQDCLLVAAKCDLAYGGDVLETVEVDSVSHRLWPISTVNGAGMPEFLAALELLLAARLAPGHEPNLTRHRHRQALEDSLAALQRFQTANAVDLAAEDLRLAVRALGRITGRVSVEDMLDLIFRDFCIGK